MTNYTPRQIADAAGVCERTVRRYLLESFASHEYNSHWRLSRAEYQFVVQQLRDAASIGTGQPRRELKRGPVLPFEVFLSSSGN